MSIVSRVAIREVLSSLIRASSAATLGGLTDEQRLDLLLKSPFAEDLVAQERAKTEQRRKEIVAAIAAAPTRAAKDLVSLGKARDAARAAFEEAEVKRRQAQDAAVATQVALSSAEDALRNEVASLELELDRTADPAISAVVSRLEQEFQDARAVDVYTRPSRFVPDPSSKRPEHEQRGAYFEGLRSAALNADRLKLTALAGEELLTALARIESSIPYREAAGIRATVRQA